ncbi:hypothetical protein FE257_012070 [Aspergillus nanangensis]|uniref:Uncharacterized protein n=1 Tax=Aspergillus nanangensis TaxID=2582783 RepID=A0AAD4CGD6_ASPNN|nr:hypothetical protein FE257_012070 [Aspergillus nanangensis]
MADLNAPDLTDVLKTLSAFSSTSASASSFPNQPQRTQTTNNDEDDDIYEPSDSLPSMSTTTQEIPRTSLSATSRISNSSRGATSTHPRTNPPLIDTSSVTTWPAALQHVMRALSQNEDLQRRIRRLIQRQHDHERQWWQGREALREKQKARVEKKKELDAVLRSVGAPVDSKQVSTAEEDRTELQNYDGKVYKASKHMAEAMMLELRTLQIPFFNIKPQFVSDTPSRSSDQMGQVNPSMHSDSSGQQTLSREELSVLQKRMLELLQDLCRE